MPAADSSSGRFLLYAAMVLARSSLSDSEDGEPPAGSRTKRTLCFNCAVVALLRLYFRVSGTRSDAQSPRCFCWRVLLVRVSVCVRPPTPSISVQQVFAQCFLHCVWQPCVNPKPIRLHELVLLNFNISIFSPLSRSLLSCSICFSFSCSFGLHVSVASLSMMSLLSSRVLFMSPIFSMCSISFLFFRCVRFFPCCPLSPLWFLSFPFFKHVFLRLVFGCSLSHRCVPLFLSSHLSSSWLKAIFTQDDVRFSLVLQTIWHMISPLLTTDDLSRAQQRS